MSCHSLIDEPVVAAEYYGRNSDCGVGVAMATNGPGVTNTITGITSAWLDSRAVVLIIGQVKTPDLKKNENIRHYGVQYVDTKQLFKGITKSFITFVYSCCFTFTRLWSWNRRRGKKNGKFRGTNIM